MSAFEERHVCGYKMGKTLGKGMSGKVKHGIRLSDGTEVALKFIDRASLQAKQMEMLSREVQAMKLLSHPNILTLQQVEEEVAYPKKRGGFRSCVMLVLELSSGGELFDYLMHTGPFDEVLARTYFRSLIAALELCHSQAICHRDIKPENLLVSADFSLKLADFGLASVNTDVNTLCSTECGTRSYMSPEVMKRAPYDGTKADIWSAGVVLFILISGFPPFQVAGGNDWWYRACAAGRHDKFWMAHLRTCPKFPPQAQELLNGIFTVDPNKRLTIDEIWEYPWMQGPVLNDVQLHDIMTQRTTVTLQEKEKEMRAAAIEKARAGGQTFDPYAANTYRSISSSSNPMESGGGGSTMSLSGASFLLQPNQVNQALETVSEQFKILGASSVKLKENPTLLKATFPNAIFVTSDVTVNGEKEVNDLEEMPSQPPTLAPIMQEDGMMASEKVEGFLHLEMEMASDILDQSSNSVIGHQVNVKKIGGSQVLFNELMKNNLENILSEYILKNEQGGGSSQKQETESILDNTAAEDDVF
mmetsp:Transcript_29749/g.35091  ORF Transcript_29749/g.35091 Transcript_29749/m.35091 type:complete len:531 (+) Transcript_29749:64-1656(+)